MMGIIGPDRGGNDPGFKTSILLDRQGIAGDSAQHRRTASFRLEGVVIPADQEFVTPSAMGQDGRQVALGAAGEEDRRFLADNSGKLPLDFENRRIIAIDVITNFGVRHGMAHGRVGPGYRIAAKVDRVIARLCH